MSLNVWLTMPGARLQKEISGIFIRENGQVKEITREEWNDRNPDHVPTVANFGPEETDEVYSANITHNLGKMADAAGIYEALWRPDENNLTKASQLVPILRAGLARLVADPAKFKEFNSPNGWGMYEHFVPFVQKYLDACREYPDADVSVSR